MTKVVELVSAGDMPSEGDLPLDCGAPGGYKRKSVSWARFPHGEIEKMTYHEWLRPLLSSDEGMHPRLLRCPPLEWVQIKEAGNEVDERRPVEGL